MSPNALSPLINSPPPHLLDAWLFLTACIRWRCASVVPAAAFLICLSSVVESPTPGSRMSQIFSSASCTSRVSSVVPSLKQSARGYKRKSGSVTHGKNGMCEREKNNTGAERARRRMPPRSRRNRPPRPVAAAERGGRGDACERDAGGGERRGGDRSQRRDLEGGLEGSVERAIADGGWVDQWMSGEMKRPSVRSLWGRCEVAVRSL